jgi:pre-mRNA-splicing factor ATP-dependent RNA helicase DHX38/PRP16
MAKVSALVKKKSEQTKAAAKLPAPDGTALGYVLRMRLQLWKVHVAFLIFIQPTPRKRLEKRRRRVITRDSKFATGVSHGSFAKNRTLKEQREYLPASACRGEPLKVLRENQG